MKKSTPTSIDGFISRRPSSQLGDIRKAHQENQVDRSLHTGNNPRQTVGVPRGNATIGRGDIDDSLREIDSAEFGSNKVSRRQRRRDRQNRPKSKTRKIIKLVAILLLLAGLAVFWILRLGTQWFVYDSSVWRGSRFRTAMHCLFSLLWIYLAGVYSVAWRMG